MDFILICSSKTKCQSVISSHGYIYPHLYVFYDFYWYLLISTFLCFFGVGETLLNEEIIYFLVFIFVCWYCSSGQFIWVSTFRHQGWDLLNICYYFELWVKFFATELSIVLIFKEDSSELFYLYDSIDNSYFSYFYFFLHSSTHFLNNCTLSFFPNFH